MRREIKVETNVDTEFAKNFESSEQLATSYPFLRFFMHRFFWLSVEYLKAKKVGFSKTAIKVKLTNFRHLMS